MPCAINTHKPNNLLLNVRTFSSYLTDYGHAEVAALIDHFTPALESAGVCYMLLLSYLCLQRLYLSLVMYVFAHAQLCVCSRRSHQDDKANSCEEYCVIKLMNDLSSVI